MDQLTAMKVFAQAVEHGSLTKAAETLKISRAMVSRYLESLETALGTRLLHRTTRHISLTNAGEEILNRIKEILALQLEIESAITKRKTEPSGRLRISTSISFAQARLANVITNFLHVYPNIQVELLVLDRAVNLIEDRVDLAIRITNHVEDTHISRHLGDCHSVICAAPSYLNKRGSPHKPSEISQHICITHQNIGKNEYKMKREGETIKVPVYGNIHCNEALIVKDFALAGAGIALLPRYLVENELSKGNLIELLPEWEAEKLGIYALYLSKKHTPQILRLLLDFLIKNFSEKNTA